MATARGTRFGPRGTAPRYWPFALAGVFLFALLWRGLYVWRLAHTPLLDYFEADAWDYWQWAAVLRASGPAPHAPFFLGPLYPYFVGLVQLVVGAGPRSLFFVQAIASSVASVLLADATRRISRPWAGIVVGACIAGYGPSVLFDGLVLAESLLFALGCGLVWLVVASADRIGARFAIVAGVLLGVMALGRATAILLIFPLVPMLVMSIPSRRIRPNLLLAALSGMALLALPVAAHHWERLHRFVPYTYSGGYNLYVGNGPLATGTYVVPTGSVERTLDSHAGAEGAVNGDGRTFLFASHGVRLSEEESSQYWARLAMDHIRESPLRALRLLGFKSALMVNIREMPQVENPHVYERLAGPLGLPFVGTFALLGTLGLAGGVLGIGRGGSARTLAGMASVIVLGTAAFFVTDRYRLHLLAPLAPLAGVALCELWDSARSKNLRRVSSMGALLGVSFGFVCLPLVPVDRVHDEWDMAATLGGLFLSKGLTATAIPQLDRAIQIQGEGQLRGQDSPAARTAMAGILQNRGVASVLEGDGKSAAGFLQGAARLAPDARSIRMQLAASLALSGAAGAARLELTPGTGDSIEVADMLLRWAMTFNSEGSSAAALQALRGAANLCPGREVYEVPLVRILLLTGQDDEAEARLEETRSAGLDEGVYLAHRAWLMAVRHDPPAAQAILARLRAAGALADPRVASTLELMNQAPPGEPIPR